MIVDSFTGVYIARPDVFPLLVLKATRLVLRHGNCEESAVVYTYYARVLAAFGDIPAAYDHSQLAVRLNEHPLTLTAPPAPSKRCQYQDQAHGGVVEVRCEGLDKGAEFTVHLPLRQPR